MTRPNGLLKVTSILHIIFSVIAIALTLVGSTFVGSLVAMLYDAAGVEGGVSAGVLSGTVLFAVAILGSVLNLVAGILGVKAKFTACKVMGIIILILTILNIVMTLSAADGAAVMIAICVVELILPVLYLWGAYKGPAQ